MDSDSLKPGMSVWWFYRGTRSGNQYRRIPARVITVNFSRAVIEYMEHGIPIQTMVMCENLDLRPE